MGKQTLSFKDPDETISHKISWVSTLATDTISTSKLINISAGTTVTATNTSTYVVLWFSGGTVGNSYELTNRITTSGGRTYDKTLRFEVWDK